MGKQPKSTNVFNSTSDGLTAILSEAIGDEPRPTPRAGEIIDAAERAGPLSPLSDTPAGGPVTVDDGPDAGFAPPTVTPRESAENLIVLLSAVLPAGDWQPENDAERDELVRAVERVFVYRGIAPSLPPELALIAVVGKYTRKRMAKPAVAAQVGPWFSRIPILGKLVGAPAPVAAPAVNGRPSQPTLPGGTFSDLPRMSEPHDFR